MINDINNNVLFSKNIFEIDHLLDGAKGGISKWGRKIIYLRDHTETIELDQLASHYIQVVRENYSAAKKPQVTNPLHGLQERLTCYNLLNKLQRFYNESDIALKQTFIIKYLIYIFSFILTLLNIIFNKESKSPRSILFNEVDWEQPLAPGLKESMLSFSAKEYADFFSANSTFTESLSEKIYRERELDFYIKNSIPKKTTKEQLEQRIQELQAV